VRSSPLINLLTNVRLTYLPDLEPADAYELLLTGAHVLIAQLGSQPATAAEISRVIGRPRDVVTQRLDELIERGYVEHRGNRYEMTTKPRASARRGSAGLLEQAKADFGDVIIGRNSRL
jgi:hypothetical protein